MINTTHRCLLQHRGLSLIELLITLGIIGIIISIAIPAFNNYLRQGHRLDAIAILLDLQQRQEKFRANNPTFANDLTDLALVAEDGIFLTPNGYYTLSLRQSSDPAEYIIAAQVTSKNNQNEDKQCQEFILTENGSDLSSPAKKNCWNQ